MSRPGSVALVFGAALADHLGAHALAFDLLLVAVPATAIAGLRTVSDRVEGKVERAQAYVWVVVLALLLVATSARASALGDPSVPAIARSALLACVAVFCLQALGLLANEFRGGSSE
jgi:hypothetical protein